MKKQEAMRRGERCIYIVDSCGFESHPRQIIFSRKSDCLGCAVLLCLVCLTLLASFFHLSFKNMYLQYTHTK